MTPQSTATRVIVYTPASLQRETWRALLAEQPFIDVLVTACEVSVVAPLVEPDQPTAVLVVVNIQYCHLLRPELRQQAGIEVVRYQEL